MKQIEIDREKDKRKKEKKEPRQTRRFNRGRETGTGSYLIEANKVSE